MARKRNKRTTPSPNGAIGRQADGRFAPGNPGGPGNPHAAAVGAWRAALVEGVTPGDVQQAVAVLVAKAKAGESWAVKELLDRCLGKAKQTMELTAPEMSFEERVRELWATPGLAEAIDDDDDTLDGVDPL